MIKSQQIRIEETYLNIRKAICKKPTASIILKGEKLKAFSLRSGTWRRCPLLRIYLTEHWKPEPLQSGKTKKRHLNWKGINKANKCVIICWRHEFSRVAGYKINILKLVVFLYIINELSEREIKKTFLLAVASKKNKIPRNKFNQEG